MKRSLPKRVVTAAAVFGMAAVLAGCGRNEPINPGIPGLPGHPGFPGGGACIPLAAGFGFGQQGTIGFSGQGVHWDGRVLKAGAIPRQQVYGQVITGGGGAGGPYGRSTGEGSISMNIQGGGQMGFPLQPGFPQQPGFPGVGSATTANIQGMVQVSSTTMNLIMSQFGGFQNTGFQQPGYMPGYYPQQPQSQVCVSGVAIDLQWNPQANMLYGGWVYLYLNNSQNGYRLYF
jgi:hypothetical protein